MKWRAGEGCEPKAPAWWRELRPVLRRRLGRRKRSGPGIGCAGAGKDPFWRAVGVAQKAAVAVACGAALPQKNRAGLSVSGHCSSRVSGRESRLPVRDVGPAPTGLVIVRNEWTAGLGGNGSGGAAMGRASQWESWGRDVLSLAGSFELRYQGV